MIIMIIIIVSSLFVQLLAADKERPWGFLETFFRSAFNLTFKELIVTLTFSYDFSNSYSASVRSW